MNATEKDLEKYIRFLALKSTQVVVQSRLGEKIQTQGSPMAGSDWFNIVIKDHPEVNLETKRVLNLTPGETIMNRFPICVEISLKTAEGDQMVLEVWSLEMQAPKDDKAGSNSSLNDQQALKGAHTIYNRMGIMIKSLISLTRATPAYKLSRRQCPDSYRIYYRIYVDRPQVHTLGEGHKHVKIGQLNTIVGNLTMSVAYRTKMTITPTTTQQRTSETNVIMLKSDHFRPSGDPQNPQQPGSGNGGYKKGSAGSAQDRKVIDIEKPLRPGAFTDLGKLRQYTEEDYILPETPPFEWLLKRTRNESSGSLESLSRKSEGGGGAASPLSNGYQHNINNNTSNNNNSNNNNMPSNGAKYPPANINNNNNAALINKNLENDENAAGKSSLRSIQSSSPPVKSLIIPTPPASRHGSTPSLQPASAATAAASQQDDDNLLKELHFPFASATSHVSDLAKFYRDCYHAPPLHGLSELQTELTAASNLSTGSPASGGSSNGAGCGVAALAAANNSDSSAVDELSRQLEQFETSLEDYDKLVAQLGLTGSSSTSSRSSGGLQMSN